jgi:hypothetical protein
LSLGPLMTLPFEICKKSFLALSAIPSSFMSLAGSYLCFFKMRFSLAVIYFGNFFLLSIRALRIV